MLGERLVINGEIVAQRRQRRGKDTVRQCRGVLVYGGRGCHPDAQCTGYFLAGASYYRKGSARFSSSSNPGSFGLRGLPGWMMDTWQFSAASTSCR